MLFLKNKKIKIMKLIFTLFSFIIFSFSSLCQEMVKIKIILTTDKNYSDKFYIAGNNDQLGNWDPSSIQIDKVNDTTYFKEFSFEKGTNLEFKFTRGSWQNEALSNEGKVLANYKVTADTDKELKYHITIWKDERPIKSEITGKVEYIRNMKYEGLKGRDVIVWLPESYEKNLDKKYPVLYVHDAQNAFDPSTSTFGIDWRIDEVTDSLIKNNIIKEIIIVAINNTSDRFSEYSYSPLGYKYMDFIINTLKPMIDSKYRTLQGPENTGVLGSSMGGLISFMLAWEHPDVFGLSACFSPAFKIDKLDYTPFVSKYDGPKKNIKFYIDNGSVGLEDSLQHGVDSMLKLLEEKGYEEGKDLIYRKFIGEEHSELAWSKRVYIPLEFFFRK